MPQVPVGQSRKLQKNTVWYYYENSVAVIIKEYATRGYINTWWN